MENLKEFVTTNLMALKPYLIWFAAGVIIGLLL
jgi:hypothetical protein